SPSPTWITASSLKRESLKSKECTAGSTGSARKIIRTSPRSGRELIPMTAASWRWWTGLRPAVKCPTWRRFPRSTRRAFPPRTSRRWPKSSCKIFNAFRKAGLQGPLFYGFTVEWIGAGAVSIGSGRLVDLLKDFTGGPADGLWWKALSRFGGNQKVLPRREDVRAHRHFLSIDPGTRIADRPRNIFELGEVLLESPGQFQSLLVVLLRI